MRILLERVSSTQVLVANTSDLMVTQTANLMAMQRQTDATITEVKNDVKELLSLFRQQGPPAAHAAVTVAPSVAAQAILQSDIPAYTFSELQALNDKLRTASFRRQLVIVVPNSFGQ